jgi:hypothetical protein
VSKSRDRALMSLPRSISVGRSASAFSGTRVSRECGWVSVLGYPPGIPCRQSPCILPTARNFTQREPYSANSYNPSTGSGFRKFAPRSAFFLRAYCLGPARGDCDGHEPELVGPCGDPLRKVSGGAPADLAAFARS